MGSSQQATDLFRLLAQYNRLANERLYQSCSLIDDAEYRRQRPVSFGSIHALLNHLLLADRIWMARFQTMPPVTLPLNTILFDDFASLRQARETQDEEILAFFHRLDDSFLKTPFEYRNSQGKSYVDQPAATLLHFFNHQAHHRGQVHTLLSQCGQQPPSLDMHRLLSP